MSLSLQSSTNRQAINSKLRLATVWLAGCSVATMSFT